MSLPIKSTLKYFERAFLSKPSFRIKSYRNLSLTESNFQMGTEENTHVKRKPDVLFNLLNYKWTLVKPNLIRTDIPTLPHDSFDSTGEKILPWSLLRLLNDSSQCCHFWPVTQPPNTPVLYMLTAGIEVDIAMYDINSPKFPLQVNCTTNYCKRSSRRLDQELVHPPTNKILAHSYLIDVNVDPKTRRPIPFPSSWKEEFGFPTEGERIEYKMPTKPEQILRATRKVHFSDIDENIHTNYASYAMFCFDAMFEFILNKEYGAGLDVYGLAMKKLTVSYRKESKLGDVLTIETWQDDISDNTFHFEVWNGPDMLTAMTISLYKLPSLHIPGANM